MLTTLHSDCRSFRRDPIARDQFYRERKHPRKRNDGIINHGLPGQTFISAACSYLTLRMFPPPKLLLLGNRPIHFRSSSSPTGFTDISVPGYGLAAMGTKPDFLSALQNSQVVASVAALSMGLPAVPGVYRFLPDCKIPLSKIEHT